MRDMAVVFELTKSYRSGTRIPAFLFFPFNSGARGENPRPAPRSNWKHAFFAPNPQWARGADALPFRS